MKLNYATQLTISFIVVIVFDILSTVCRHWIFHSIGFCIDGFLWIIHPVMMHDQVPTAKEKTIIRIAGLLLIVIGIFTRAYY